MTRFITTMTLVLASACTTAPTTTPEPPSGGGKADEPGPPSKPAIPIEVDFVGYQRFQPGTIEIITSYFDSIGYTVTFEQDEVLEPVDVLDYGKGSAMLAGYYRDHFGHRGQPGWHYMLMADTIVSSNLGWGMLGGDMFVIADQSDTFPDHPTEAQAHIILHELGHNLGLLHEGFEPELTAGTHSEATCATANSAPSPDVPVTFYSANCIEHLQLAVQPYLTGA